MGNAPLKEDMPEFRGFWVDAYNTGLHTKESIDLLVKRAREANMNALIVQMRKRGDAHYNSLLEPRATNQSAEFDSLAYLIEKAHNESPRLEVHVWVNSHPIWPGSGWPEADTHLLNRFPEIQTEDVDGNRVTEVGYGADWGHPFTNDFFTKVLLDVVKRYNVDGIHFDYIRYTGEKWGYNPVSIERFNHQHNRTGKPKQDDALWKQWRRDQVTAVVRKIYVNATALKPNLKVSAALITWGDGPKDTGDWVNRSAYRSVFQDWQSWLKEGILDMAVPMIYYNQANPTYKQFYANWINYFKDHQHGRHGVIGIGNYLNSLDNTFEQIDWAKDPSLAGNRAKGINFFSYAATQGRGTEEGVKWNDDTFYTKLQEKFPTPVPLPEMPWKTNPTTGHIKGTVLQAGDLAWQDGALIELYQDGRVVRSQKTDGTGHYAFVGLEPGIYTLKATSTGDPVVQSGRLQVTPGFATTFNFLMGKSSAPEVRRIASLSAYSEGTEVILLDQSISSVEPDTVTLKSSFGNEQILVLPSDTRFPWTPGDIVSVKGTLKSGANGTRVIENAVVRWTGSSMP